MMVPNVAIRCRVSELRGWERHFFKTSDDSAVNGVKGLV